MKKRKARLHKPAEDEPTSTLTPKEQLFVDGYLAGARFNATEAMRLAGYKGSAGVLGVSGHRLLRKAKIAALILERLNEHAMSANEVLARLSKQARGSLADVLNEEGNFDLAALRQSGFHDLLKKLKIKKTVRHDGRGRAADKIEEVTHELEIHDPQAALVHLGRFHKLFVDRHEVTGKNGIPLIPPVADALAKAYGPPDKS